MFAQFFEDEAAARAAMAAWEERVRGDWEVDRPREVFRQVGNPWTEGSVAPSDRCRVRGRLLRLIRAEARGPFARGSGDYHGTSTAVLEVAFPAEV
jgi:hypothetical protein